MRLSVILPFFLCALFCAPIKSSAQGSVIPVDLNQRPDGSWQLMREGEPYFIKGAGGHVHLDELVAIGGNSIRTWSADDAEKIMDDAHARGLTVMMGLWVQHERHGFDYDNEAAVAAQLERFRKIVLRIKDHPALLLWGIGNEVDLQYSNTKVWYAINDIAKMIHELDPYHPTSTVTAGLDQEEVRLIKERAPEIDIYGINTYGDLPKVKENLREFGWDGPYIISEWGPNGHWEVEKTSWGAPIEQSSAEKAESYRTRYKRDILGDLQYCIGSYVFLWGFKQETTSTWYGMFLDSGEASPAVGELENLWTRKKPANLAPELTGVTLFGQKKGEDIYLTAEEAFEVFVNVSDADNDRLRYRYEFLRESTDIKSGGDAESRPDGIRGLILSRKNGTMRFRAPSEEGPYRLFVYVFDGKGHVAYTNIPFYVTPRPRGAEQSTFVKFKQMDMNSFDPITP